MAKPEFPEPMLVLDYTDRIPTIATDVVEKPMEHIGRNARAKVVLLDPKRKGKERK